MEKFEIMIPRSKDSKKQMPNLNPKTKLFYLALWIFGYSIIPNQSFAQERNTISVMPQITRLDLSVDKPEAQIIYTNNTKDLIELALTVENVKELEERNPVGLVNPAESANYKYALASWVYLDRQNVQIGPGETQTINVNIDQEKLSPGGHYGAILAEIKQADVSKEIKLKGVLTSLLFVRASTGFEIEEAKISSFDPARSGLEFPESFVLRFQNTGNVDLTPYGLIEIKDFRGSIVAKSIVNEGSLSTLPESIRRYDIPVNNLQSVILPGRYTVEVNMHYGKGRKEIKYKSEFYTQGNAPAFSALTALGIIGIVLIALRLKRKRKKNPIT